MLWVELQCYIRLNPFREDVELSSSPQYATLHGKRDPKIQDPLDDTFDISEPREGFYNTLPRVMIPANFYSLLLYLTFIAYFCILLL